MSTASQFKNRLIAEAPNIGVTVTTGQAAKMGIRLARRAERMAEQFDFYESLRILGLISDTTARDAVANLEAAAA